MYSVASAFRRASAARQRSRGFTLIEVMITVAIVAILASIALPSYRDYVLRGQLVDATNLLSAGRANMERYFQDNRTYASVTVGGTTIYPPCSNNIAVASRTQGSFVLTCTSDANGYTLTATGSGGTNGFTYTVNTTDTRSTTIASPAPWTAGSYTCWILKKGQSC